MRFELDVDHGLIYWSGWKKDEFFNNGFWVATEEDIKNQEKFIPDRVSSGKEEIVANEPKPHIRPSKERYKSGPEYVFPNYRFSERKKKRSNRINISLPGPKPHPSIPVEPKKDTTWSRIDISLPEPKLHRSVPVEPKKDTTWSRIDKAISELEIVDDTFGIFEQKGPPLVLTKKLVRPPKPNIHLYDHLFKLFSCVRGSLNEIDTNLKELENMMFHRDFDLVVDEIRNIFYEIRVLTKPDVTFLCSDGKVFAHRKVLEAGYITISLIFKKIKLFYCMFFWTFHRIDPRIFGLHNISSIVS